MCIDSSTLVLAQLLMTTMSWFVWNYCYLYFTKGWNYTVKNGVLWDTLSFTH